MNTVLTVSLFDHKIESIKRFYPYQSPILLCPLQSGTDSHRVRIQNVGPMVEYDTQLRTLIC